MSPSDPAWVSAPSPSRDDDPLDMVMAKLYRPPQDQLQAAVVLEAWAGKKAPDSFFVVASNFADDGPAEPPPVNHGIEPGARLSDFAILFTIVASAILWIPWLQPHLGDRISTAVSVGLPLALALDGAFRIRYLSAGNVRGLRSILPGIVLVLGGGLVVGLLVAQWLAVAASLVVLWGLANLVGSRGWYGLYGAMALAGAVAMWRSPWDVEIIVGLAGLTLALCAVAVRTDPAPRSKPESALASVSAFVIGGSSGVMLVADPGVWRAATWSTTAAVLLVTLTGWIASARLTRIWLELPARLAVEPIARSEVVVFRPVTSSDEWAAEEVVDHLTGDRMTPVVTRIERDGRPDDTIGDRLNAVGRAVLAASARVVIPTLIALAIYAAADAQRGAAIVSGFTLFALATLAISLNVATRHWSAAATIAAVGAAITLVVPDDISGLPLLCGAGFVVVVSGLLAFVTFRDAGVAFATRMLIR